MPEEQDFERAWLARFSSRLDEIAGEETRKEVMKGGRGLQDRSASAFRLIEVSWVEGETFRGIVGPHSSAVWSLGLYQQGGQANSRILGRLKPGFGNSV